MLATVKPWLEWGSTTIAAQAVMDMEYVFVPLTPLSLPPGAEVVSTSTTVELST